MSRRGNGAMVLMIFILDIIMSYAWYTNLYPIKAVSHINAVLGGAILMFFTLLSLGTNALVYSIAIAEDS